MIFDKNFIGDLLNIVFEFLLLLDKYIIMIITHLKKVDGSY